MRASASSRKMTLNVVPGDGAVLANCLTLVRMDSSLRSSLAFISSKLIRYPSPNTSLVRARAAVVLPVPGGPANSKCGKVRLSAYALSRSTMAFWPLISPTVWGRWRSTHNSLMTVLPNPDAGVHECCEGLVGPMLSTSLPRLGSPCCEHPKHTA